MFEHLLDADPPRPGRDTRQEVAARARRMQGRARRIRAAAVVLVAAVLFTGGIATSQRQDGPSSVEFADVGRTCCGSIEGTVRDAATVLPGASVKLIRLSPGRSAEKDAPWPVSDRQVSDFSGRFVFSGLEAGSYAVFAEDRVDPLLQRVRHVPSFFPTVPVLSQAQPLVVRPDRSTPVDVVLELSPTTTISGHVYESNQRFPILGITARLFLDGEFVRETDTDSMGSYDFGGVPAGTYTMVFLDEMAAGRPTPTPFGSAWYAGPDRPEGSLLAVPFDLGNVSIGADVVLAR